MNKCLLILLAQPFAFESSSIDNRVNIGKHESGLASEVAEVRVKQHALYCFPIISESVADIRTWMILPYIQRTRLRAAYFFDSDSQFFVNQRSKKKQPLVYRGSTSVVENSDPPLVDNYYRISKGKYFTRGHPEALSGGTSQIASTITHIVKVRFRSLPKKILGMDTSELLYTFTADKIMKIYVTFDRRFSFKIGSETKTTKSFDFINFKWYHLRITFSRGLYPAHFFDCSVEIEIVGVGRDGQELLCK